MTQRITRTFVGVMLAVLLGMLVAPLNAIHPRTRHTPASTATK